VAAYDVQYSKFQEDINRERTLTDTVGDLTSLTLTALGASLGAVSTKTALAASATAVTGAKASFDKNLFYDKTLPVLFAQMDANRAAVLVRIEAGAALPDAQYPLTRALADLNAYREAGSIPGALAGIAQAAGQKQQQALRAIYAMRGIAAQ
jgi:hypothetical protein